MNNNMTKTGEQIKYENGNTFYIYSKMTKKGLRHYRYSMGRFFPISRIEIDQRIVLNNPA
jgi:hypothetical protein